jgi:putative acetyltransferase
VILRDEAPSDAAAIRRLTEVAFEGAEHGSGTEPAILDGLRDRRSLTLSLVAEAGGQIVGHVAFSPVRIDGEAVRWSGLGPVSVLPSRQGEGIGSALIDKGLARLKAGRWLGCVVLGNPAYYRRFGFRTRPDLWFADVPPEAFMALSFGASIPAGEVVYDPAFYP